MPTTSLLHLLPAECLLLVLKSCESPSQALTLSSICKLMHSIFLLNLPSILRNIGRSQTLAFENALMAVSTILHDADLEQFRSSLSKILDKSIASIADLAPSKARATKISLDCFHKGELPPDPFPFDALGSKKKPSLQEFQHVFEWEHLIKCIENICLKNTEWGKACAGVASPNSSAWLYWRENLHRSVYRVFLIGAVLCRKY